MLLVLLAACADDSVCSPGVPIGPDEGVLVVRPRVPALVQSAGRVFVGALVDDFGVFGADVDPDAGCAVLVLPPGTYTTWVYANNADETRCGWAARESVVLAAGAWVEREPTVVMDECSTDTAVWR